MSDPTTVQIRDQVTFVDAHRKPHPALVTAVWGREVKADGSQVQNSVSSCINIVVVSHNDKEHDEYGRQIKRHTSLVHSSLQSEGMYWK